MDKNGHNREHGCSKPGKATFLIANLLPTGKENAIPIKELVQLCGLSSARELQIYIAAERKAGAVICSSTTGGYFLPASHEEMAEFCKALENRAKNTFAAIQSVKRALNKLEGQQVFKEVLHSNGK